MVHDESKAVLVQTDLPCGVLTMRGQVAQPPERLDLHGIGANREAVAEVLDSPVAHQAVIDCITLAAAEVAKDAHKMFADFWVSGALHRRLL